MTATAIVEMMHRSPTTDAIACIGGNDEPECESPEPAKPRYTVEAMHTPSNGFDGPRTVEYWRVFDSQTGMRANGTAKYQDAAQARAWCDHLNRTAEPS